MPQQGPPLVERALGALAGHHHLLRALEGEPARRRDVDDASASTVWLAWHDGVLEPAWIHRDEAITLLLEHPDYPEWHAKSWRDTITAPSRVPYVWRPVATTIAAELGRRSA